MEIFQFKGPNLYPECAGCEVMASFKNAVIEHLESEGRSVTNLEISCQQRGWRGGLVTVSETGRPRVPVIKINYMVSFQFSKEGRVCSGGLKGDEEDVDCPHFYNCLKASG